MIGAVLFPPLVYSHDRGCPVPSIGAQVDSKSVDNMTYAEVLELLESYSLKRWQCIITVQQNLEGRWSFKSHDHCMTITESHVHCVATRLHLS